MIRIKYSSYAGLLALMALSVCMACQKDEPVATPNAPETITKITYTLTPLEGGDPVFWSYSDPDGPGGISPQIVFEPIKPYTIYNGVVAVYNDLANPEEDLTSQIMMEGGEHQFFYTFTDVLASYLYMDYDENGFPLGLRTRFFAYGPCEGLLNIKLIHDAQKAVPGVSDGDITNAGGLTDLDITFHIVIEE